MSTLTPTTVVAFDPDGGRDVVPRRLTVGRDRGDRAFRGAARGGGVAVLAIMTLIGAFLGYRASTSLRADGFKFLTLSDWHPERNHFGVVGVLSGSGLIALTAIFFALPLACGMALFITEYTAGRAQRFLIGAIDLMAAVPSVVFGLWGLVFLQQNGVGVARFLNVHFGWIPVFRVAKPGFDPTSPLAAPEIYTASTFIAGMVVALMVTPIACSIMREAFSRAPLGEREGAYALGATRWGMIRTVVLPFGRGGIIGGTMLALGRALGETIAIYMIISLVFGIQPRILRAGGSSVSALIAARFGNAQPLELSALMAAGLALFVVTLAVNFAAAAVVARSRSGADSEA